MCGYNLVPVSVDEDGEPVYGRSIEFETYCYDDFRRDEGECEDLNDIIKGVDDRKQGELLSR